MTPPDHSELERIKGWETLGPRGRKEDLGAMVKALEGKSQAHGDAYNAL